MVVTSSKLTLMATLKSCWSYMIRLNVIVPIEKNIGTTLFKVDSTSHHRIKVGSVLFEGIVPNLGWNGVDWIGIGWRG